MLSSVVGTWKIMLRAQQMMELVKSQEEAETSGAVPVIF